MKIVSGFIVLLLLAIGFLFSLIQNQNNQITDLQNSIAGLKNQIEVLQLVQTKQRRNPAPVTRTVISAPSNPLKARVFQFLYSINGTASSENASVPKKIRYLPGQLIVQDLSIVQDDRFFDLIGVLLDENAIQKIELPVRPHGLRKELLEFGVSLDLISSSKNPTLVININKFKD